MTSLNTTKSNNLILCEVLNPGIIYLYKKIFLMEKEIVSEMGISPITAKDIADINKTLKCGIGILAALVNKASDIDEIKYISGEEQSLTVYARIETSEAIYNFDSILEKSDGIIIHHGLLSSKIPYEEVTFKTK
jgi:pyruvate kinase